MEVKIEGNKLTIKGNIKSLEDYEKIKSALDTIKVSNNVINIFIEDSISITSSVIGYLLKIKNEGKNINLYVKKDTLYEILDDLELIKELNVRRMQ